MSEAGRPLALVTGGSRGIGRAIALRLAADGFDIVLTCRSRRQDAEAVVQEIRELGCEARVLQLDLGRSESVEQLVANLTDGGQRVSVLVNNAGEIRDALFMFQTDEDLVRVLEADLVGTIRLTKGVLKEMLRHRSGRIINISSDSGLVGNAGQTSYSAAKGGIVAFSKSLARETGAFSVTVNVVAPGFIETEILVDLPKKKRASALDSIPLGRFGEPHEVAGVVSWLAGPGGAYLTGAVIRVDGGLTA